MRLPQRNSAHFWLQRGAEGSSGAGLLGPGPGGHPELRAARPGYNALQRGIWPYLQTLQRHGFFVSQFHLCRGLELWTSSAKGFENDPGKTLDPNGFQH